MTIHTLSTPFINSVLKYTDTIDIIHNAIIHEYQLSMIEWSIGIKCAFVNSDGTSNIVITDKIWKKLYVYLCKLHKVYIKIYFAIVCLTYKSKIAKYHTSSLNC